LKEIKLKGKAEKVESQETIAPETASDTGPERKQGLPEQLKLKRKLPGLSA
jgi:hypothetical protein